MDNRIQPLRLAGAIPQGFSYEKTKERYDELVALRSRKMAKAKAINRFIATLSRREELLTEFDNRLWLTLADYVTVRRDGKMTFRFFDGTEITN